MNKKRFYIITTCCIIAIFVIFEIAVYCLVGEDELIKNEKMRALWIGFPIVVVGLSFLRDLIIKKYMNGKEQYIIKNTHFEISKCVFFIELFQQILLRHNKCFFHTFVVIVYSFAFFKTKTSQPFSSNRSITSKPFCVKEYSTSSSRVSMIPPVM